MIEFLIGFFFAGGDEGDEDQHTAQRTMQVVGSILVLVIIVATFVLMG